MCLQENDPQVWRDAQGDLLDGCDMVLWTRTGWDWRHFGIAPEEAHRLQRGMLSRAKHLGVPTVGYHLDRWWGLKRQTEVFTEPFFRCDTVVTADGGHPEQWQRAGVNHVWMPPGVSEFECGGGTPRPEMASDIAFCGSWIPGYHPEWQHRPQLVARLSATFGDRCRFWPPRGEPAVRGEALRDLYASVKVLVGDSCLSGGATHYWSDRIPETLGRGGFLIHPYVEGIEEHFDDNTHLRLWKLGDWDQLHRLVDHYLTHDDQRQAIAAAGRAHVLEHHTYTVRMRQVFDLVGLS